MIHDEEQARAWVADLCGADPSTLEMLDQLVELLSAENERQNLVAKPTLVQVWRRHIADSAQLTRHVPRGTSAPWLDLGSGAGFPGLVVAILKPELRVTLVESRRKRIDWLRDVSKALDLRNVTVAGCRVEALPSQHFDVISARAFASLENIVALSARFSTSATTWVLPKGRSAVQELEQLTGWSHTFHVEPSLTDPDAGIVVGTLAGRKGAKP